MMVVPKNMFNQQENDCQPACLHKEAILEFRPHKFYDLLATHNHRVEQILEPLFTGVPHQNVGRLSFALVASEQEHESRTCSDLTGYPVMDETEAVMASEAIAAAHTA